jgi:hypothetical protein
LVQIGPFPNSQHNHEPQASRREENMKHPRLWVVLGFSVLLTSVSTVVLSHAQEGGNPGFTGGSYLITNKVSGTFFSRGVVTLHADHTMSVTDSAQGGPLYYFTSELGSWKQDGSGRIIARTIDFDYPPDADVARLDFTLNLSPDGRLMAGSAVLTTYPLEDPNPLEGEGTNFGTFTITGELIKP